MGTKDEPYWAFVPLSFAHLQPLELPTERHRRPTKPKAKAFANPNSYGYGGGETPWPFDRERAKVDVRYRTGIRNAIHSDWTASNWKFVAKALLIEILEELIREAD